MRGNCRLSQREARRSKPRIDQHRTDGLFNG